LSEDSTGGLSLVGNTERETFLICLSKGSDGKCCRGALGFSSVVRLLRKSWLLSIGFIFHDANLTPCKLPFITIQQVKTGNEKHIIAPGIIYALIHGNASPTDPFTNALMVSKLAQIRLLIAIMTGIIRYDS
jgi:hypothetical protein